ncbi:M16 family metallopeptidase [Myroides odoratimimus]|uniref:M16 family metallopeptidase n=1 Tax=Myroides odoratimimus TaxID=76832 RepID=UPI0025785CFA|nr:M16 family metallopeptidase [Myroides odoratimimus]MDM1519936.1 insulinase family protein [Myroides odoratimimus]
MKRTQILYFFALVLCPLLVVGQGTFSPLPKAEKAIYGTLDNGLNYIIHPIPQQKTEYRLVLNVGSLQERDDEKGFAHFLEHMIFNGSDDFPGRQAIDTLQRLGYQFGRDINAYTTYERTVYDLSLLDIKQQDLAINILANFLGKSHLHNEGIEKERRIVIQEIKDFGTEPLFNRKKLEGTPHLDRLPIATEKEILNLDPVKLRAFYKRWYNPALATIIIVGKVNTKDAIEQINKYFSSFKGQSNLDRKQSENTFSPVYTNLLEKQSNATINSNKLEIVRFTEAPFLASKEDYRQQLIEQIYKQWINKKLSMSKSTATAHSLWYLPNKNENAIEIQAKTVEELQNRISLVASTVNTMSVKGIHKKELEHYKQHLLNHSVPSEDEDIAYITNAYVDQVVVNSHYLSSIDRHALLTELLPTITTKDIESKHSNTWSTDQENLYLLTYNDSLFSIDSADELNKYWNEGSTKTLVFKSTKQKKTHERPRGSFHWRTMPPIQKATTDIAVKEQLYADINLTELTLANGLRIGIKPTKATDDNYIMTLFTRNGLNQIPTSEQKYYQDAGYFIDSSWIHGFTNDGYMQAGSDREISTLVSINKDASIINTSSRKGNSKDLFEWTYRKLYDYITPQQDFKEYIEESISSIDTTAKPSALLDNPAIKIGHQIEEYKKGGSLFSEELTTIEDWKKVNLDSFFTLYNQSFANLEEVYVLIAGNFDTDDIKKKAIAYFGALNNAPKQGDKNKANSSKAFAKEEITRATLTSSNIERPDVTIVFNGTIKPTLKESMMAHIVREMFNNQFLTLSREKEGLVYSPYSALDVEVYPEPRTSVSLFFSTSLTDIDKLENLAKEVIHSLQTKSISKTELEQMKLTILNNKRLHLTDTSTFQWVEKLRETLLNFGSLEDFNNYDAILNSITPEDIKEISKSIFNTSTYGVFILTPQ